MHRPGQGGGYSAAPKGWFLTSFGLKLGIDLNRLGLKSGKVLYTPWNQGRELGLFFSRCNFFLLSFRSEIGWGKSLSLI